MKPLTVALTAALISLGAVDGLGAQLFGGSRRADGYELASLPRALRQGTNGQPQNPHFNTNDTTSPAGRSLVGRSVSGANLRLGPQHLFGAVNDPSNPQGTVSRWQDAVSMLTAMLPRQGTNGQPQNRLFNPLATISPAGLSLVGRSVFGANRRLGSRHLFGEVDDPSSPQVSAPLWQDAASMLTAMLPGLLGLSAH